MNATLPALTRSSRGLLRQARARFSTDLLTASFRDEFERVWQKASAVPGWFDESSAALFYGLIREQRPTTIVEIGSYLGRSTVFFASAVEQMGTGGQVVSIDPHTGDRQHLAELGAESIPSFELFQAHCRAAGVDDVVLSEVATSLEVAARWSGAIDVLFVDGWHSYDAVLADGEAWLPHLSARGVAVFDDYVAYREVARAVDQLDGRHGFHLWGSVFGQAVGGRTEQPPPAVRRALLLGRGGLRRHLASWLGR